MDLDVIFLGTAGSVPSAARQTAATLIRRGGERILVDCGEGTQRQMMRYGVSFALGDILFTHFHTDHFLGVLGLLFCWKMIPKLAGVYPVARRFATPHAAFTTLLMSTGLTFGTISALYGLNAGIIDRTQFSLLVATVVLSAVVPTAIAQRFYQPRLEELRDITAPVPPAQLAGE